MTRYLLRTEANDRPVLRIQPILALQVAGRSDFRASAGCTAAQDVDRTQYAYQGPGGCYQEQGYHLAPR
jgi:hypothetical protein